MLAGPNRSAAGLETLLSSHLGVSVVVRTFVGQWLPLDLEDRCRFSRAAPSRLGRDIVAGARVRDVQGRFRVVVGPLALGAFRALLPDGAAYRSTVDLVRLYVGPQFDFDLELRLRSADVPPLKIGGLHARLGYTTWSAAGSADGGDRSVTIPARER